MFLHFLTHSNTLPWQLYWFTSPPRVLPVWSSEAVRGTRPQSGPKWGNFDRDEGWPSQVGNIVALGGVFSFFLANWGRVLIPCRFVTDSPYAAHIYQSLICNTLEKSKIERKIYIFKQIASPIGKYTSYRFIYVLKGRKGDFLFKSYVA